METLRQTIIDRNVREKTVFNASNLTAAMAYAETQDIRGASKGCLLVDYDRGAEEVSSKLVFRFNYSHDGTTWFQESSGTTPHDFITHNVDPGAGSGRTIAIPFDIPPAPYMQVGVKETGVVTNFGTITLTALWMP